MSDLSSFGILASGLAIALSVLRSVRSAQFGHLLRSGDPVAFWGFMAFLLTIVAPGVSIAASNWIE